MNEVDELSCPSQNYSEASSAFMTEENWHFEQDHIMENDDDCSNTTITNDLEEDCFIATSSLPRVKNNYFLQKDTVALQMETSQQQLQQSVTTKHTVKPLTAQETCSTPKTEEQGCDSVSLASSKSKHVSNASKPVEDHYPLQEQPMENPTPIMERSSSHGSSGSVSPEVSATAKQNMKSDITTSKAERYHQEDSSKEPRTSLNSRVEDAVEGAPIDCEDTNNVDETSKNPRYSNAAQSLLQSKDVDDSPNEELLGSLKRQSKQDDDQPVKEQRGAGCDDLLLDICNGLADHTLYACHFVMMCMCDDPPQLTRDDDDTVGESSEIAMINIPEEPYMAEPLVPQIVRKGHVLPQIVQNEQDTSLQT